VFSFSQQTLHNIFETAPETWDGGPYDEKSDVFSFAVILWQLFGTKAQNEIDSTEYQDSGDPTTVDLNTSEDEGEYEYLKENGRYVPPPQQREIIRKVPLSVRCSIIIAVFNFLF
jgi:hypothetical protein